MRRRSLLLSLIIQSNAIEVKHELKYFYELLCRFIEDAATSFILTSCELSNQVDVYTYSYEC